MSEATSNDITNVGGNNNISNPSSDNSNTAAREIEIAPTNAGIITEVELIVSEASQAQPIHCLF